MEFYLWLKALHVTAVVTWIGGMIATTLMLPAFTLPGHRVADMLLKKLILWDRRVTTPAMLAAWAAGMAMAVEGHWFALHWLKAKLFIVFLLSALHGILSGTLRRTASQAPARELTLIRHAAPSIIACVSLIAILVIVKPF